MLAGAFNPPTLAHRALLDAASGVLDCVVCALPREYPHKQLTGATLDQRVRMLARLGLTVVLADRGLFIDMAREFRRDFGQARDLHFICGRDAADRITGWDYGPEQPPIGEQLREYRLLVARRQGDYRPPAALAHGVGVLDAGSDWDEVSSTRVREWIAVGDPRWRDLIPSAIAGEVETIYGNPA